MDLTGKIIAVLPANSGVSSRTGNPWMSQEFVIEVPGQYPRKCVFRVFGEDRIKQFNIQMGEDITISFDIDAHEYNGRWFNEIRAYNVTRGQQRHSWPSSRSSCSWRCSRSGFTVPTTGRQRSLPTCSGTRRRG